MIISQLIDKGGLLCYVADCCKVSCNYSVVRLPVPLNETLIN